VKTTGPIVRLASRLNDASDAHVREELEKLPSALDAIDRWIADGVLDGAELNAADYQLAPTLRLLTAFDDLRSTIEGRPAGALAVRVLPEPLGRIPPCFPADWLAGLSAATPA
jgi:glutathione S-transferase